MGHYMMKDNMKLAIEGGTPVRDNPIYYGRQWIDEDDIKAVIETLKSPYITCGPKVLEFEQKLCKYTGARYAVAVSNGTAALHCAMLAAGIGPGDEVITTPLTFAASANCALYCGAHPVFADVNPNTYNIDPDSIERCITDRTKAIVAVDFTGQAVEVERIRRICDKYGLIFIEDAAHSIGTKYSGTMVGNLADMTTFSFHPVKTITGGEGGAIMTNSETFYDALKLARSHGITHDECKMSVSEPDGAWYYEQISLGYNYRMTDFQAALLISQLSKIDVFKKRRREIVNMYDSALKNIPGIILQQEIEESDTCRHLYTIGLDYNILNCSHKEFFDAMEAENVVCQVHYIPVYWFPYYKHLGYERGQCKNAEVVYSRIMSIPLYPKMDDEDVKDVIKAVRKVATAYLK